MKSNQQNQQDRLVSILKHTNLFSFQDYLKISSERLASANTKIQRHLIFLF